MEGIRFAVLCPHLQGKNNGLKKGRLINFGLFFRSGLIFLNKFQGLYIYL